MSQVGLREVLTAQLPHYVRKIRWLFSDAYARFGKRIRAVLLLDAVGVITGGLWLAGLVLYVDSLQNHQALSQRWPMVPDLSAVPTPLIVTAFIALGLVSAVSLYTAQWRVARICVDYQKATAARILEIVSDPMYFGWQTTFPEPPQRLILRFTGVTLQLTSMSLRRLLRGALPAAVLVFAFIALVIANPWLSLLLIPIGLLYLAPLYVANRRAARAHIDSVALTPRVRGRLIALIGRLLAQPEGRAPVLARAQRVIASRDFDRSLELVFRKRLADSMVNFINTLFTVACLVALFAYFFTRGDGRWSELLLYLVALRFAIGGLGGVTSVLVGLSRFLPEYERLSHFLDAAEDMARRRAEGKLAETLPQQARLVPPGEGPALSVSPGDALWIIAPPPVAAVDRDRILLLLEKRLRPSVNLAPFGVASNVLCLRPSELGGAQRAQDALTIVLDGFPRRLARARWSNWRDRLAAVLVYDGTVLVAGGDASWYLDNVELVATLVESAKTDGPAAGDADELY